VGSSFVRVVLPAGLASGFSVTAELTSSGAEADIVLARELSTGRVVVVKLYRRGVAPDEVAVARLAEASRPGAPGWAHVVEVLAWGQEEGCWFEVLEYCRHGSLRTLMDDGPRPAVVDVVREVAAALGLAHGLGLVHRDLKPENVLVREVAPLDLVLGDFGLARAVDASVRWTRAWGTPAYSPPELAGGEVSPAWDWWSLGMMAAELAAGRHPFELAGGMMMADQQIQASLAQRPVDLSAVGDARISLLCRGLLARDRQARWGAAQVADWLAGGSPAVGSDGWAPPAGTAGAPGSARTVLFAGSEHSSPASLAAAFQARWAEARRRLFEDRDPGLAEEVERLLRQHQMDEAVRVLRASSNPSEVPRRFGDLLAEMDPGLEPVYNGLRLTAAGLEAAALEVARLGGASPTAAVLDEVRRQNVLTRWRRLPGMGHGPATQEAWAAANADLEKTVEGLKAKGYTPSGSDWAVGRAWLLLCVLAPAHHEPQLRALVGGLDATYAARRAWWASLRNSPSNVAMLLSVMAHPVAVQQEHEEEEAARLAQERQDRERRQRQLEDQRQAEARERERVAQTEARRRQARRECKSAIGSAFWVIFGTATFASVVGTIWADTTFEVNGNSGYGPAIVFLFKVSAFTSIPAFAASVLFDLHAASTGSTKFALRHMPTWHKVLLVVAAVAPPLLVVLAHAGTNFSTWSPSPSGPPQWFWWVAPVTMAIVHALCLLGRASTGPD
jgi:hypothetical protein